MTDARPVEILCGQCGREALLLRQPRYEGFQRTGETLSCSACGHVYASEAEVPFRHRPRVEVFSAADLPAPVRVFRDGEQGRLCRYCRSYVVNPFVQWCARQKKEVEATDTCAGFEARPPELPPAAPAPAP